MICLLNYCQFPVKSHKFPFISINSHKFPIWSISKIAQLNFPRKDIYRNLPEIPPPLATLEKFFLGAVYSAQLFYARYMLPDSSWILRCFPLVAPWRTSQFRNDIYIHIKLYIVKIIFANCNKIRMRMKDAGISQKLDMLRRVFLCLGAFTSSFYPDLSLFYW